MDNKKTYVFMDVDGTLTDGKIAYTESGQEIKSFNVRDGLIISRLLKYHYCFVIITGRKSKIVLKRMKELGILEIYQGIHDKKTFLQQYFDRNEVDAEQTYYIGDDLNDLGAMNMCAHKACPANACQEIKEVADIVSLYTGGNGAVREILEIAAKKQGIWEEIIGNYE